jgi:hypothetical protein
VLYDWSIFFPLTGEMKYISKENLLELFPEAKVTIEYQDERLKRLGLWPPEPEQHPKKKRKKA